jgi:hypothetical protein
VVAPALLALAALAAGGDAAARQLVGEACVARHLEGVLDYRCSRTGGSHAEARVAGRELPASATAVAAGTVAEGCSADRSLRAPAPAARPAATSSRATTTCAP